MAPLRLPPQTRVWPREPASISHTVGLRCLEALSHQQVSGMGPSLPVWTQLPQSTHNPWLEPLGTDSRLHIVSRATRTSARWTPGNFSTNRLVLLASSPPPHSTSDQVPAFPEMLPESSQADPVPNALPFPSLRPSPVPSTLANAGARIIS